MKRFFSSTWFRCTAVLLSLVIVLGGGLAILNDVLYVDPAERTARAIKKIYGTEKEYTILLDVEDATRTDVSLKFTDETGKDIGEISKIYKIDNDMLFKSTGSNGYKGGTITLWIKVVTDQNQNKFIDKIVLESFEKQTLMSKLDGSFYSKFYVDVTKAYKEGTLFNSTNDNSSLVNPITGATKSAYAACCAVNCVIEYLGGMTDEN